MSNSKEVRTYREMFTNLKVKYDLIGTNIFNLSRQVRRPTTNAVWCSYKKISGQAVQQIIIVKSHMEKEYFFLLSKDYLKSEFIIKLFNCIVLLKHKNDFMDKSKLKIR